MIPTVEDLRSDPMVHRFGDLFAPPGLTNFLGCVQTDFDVAATRSLTFPPFGAGDTVTGALFLDDRLFLSTGRPVTHTWYPDRVVREATWDGIAIRTTTVMPMGAMAVLVLIELRNSGPARDLAVRLGLVEGATLKTEAWDLPETPHETAHDARVEPDAGAVVFRARTSGAIGVQAAHPAPDAASPTGLDWRARLGAGETFEIAFAHALGENEDDVVATALALTRYARATIATTRDAWNDELAAIFTPGNDRYSGSLPVLETEDLDVARVYWMGALGTAYFKRESPRAAVPRAYDTLMPRYWPTVTFLWDYSLSSLVHALLDPAEMRGQLERWMTTDIHTCFGTDRLTGGPIGGWYSVNDFAMTKMIADLVRWDGARDWLGTDVAGEPVAGRLERYATNWRRFRTPNGLADYGGIGNLLECVSTYVHEVAAMNAANVFNLRTAAAYAAPARADELRTEADALVAEIGKLYVPGAGHFATRFPDGSLVPVKHAYDFITVLGAMAEDLSETQRREMAAFCARELRTETWMHALAPSDADAVFSVRPDHQWTGAYPAWPPLAVQGLYRIGETDAAFAWLKGLARAANQGPYAQAHFADPVVEPEAGGARKAPPDFPYITDWACSSNGAFSAVVIESIFGVAVAPDGTPSARPAFGPFDPGAQLRNLRIGDRYYDVDREGLRPA